LVVFHDGDAVSGGKAVEQCMRGLHVAGLKEIDGGSGFYEQEDLRGLLDGSKIRKRLFGSVIENVKVFTAKPADKFSVCIGDDYTDVDAIDADTNRLRLRRGSLLCSHERRNCNNYKHQ